jgi:replicative DNA helicase Mcm
MYKEYLLEFLRRYYHKDLIDFQNRYPDELSYYVDSMDLHMFNRELSEGLLQDPIDFLKAADIALQTHLTDYNLSVEHNEYPGVRLRFTSSAIIPKVSIRDIRACHIGKFISVEGMVRKVSPVKPRHTFISFICRRCEHVTTLPQPEDKLVEPCECENETCGRKGPFNEVKDPSSIIDYQRILLQESPETVQGSSQPQELILEIEGDITGHITPGSRVIVNGYIHERFKIKGNSKTPDCEISLCINSIEFIDSNFEEIEITPEEEQQILELSKNPDIKEYIVSSIIPSIHGFEDVKEAMVYQLFSGVPKTLPNGTQIRGDIHILMVGDPGTAKSQMLRAISKISPRAIFASGKGASAAGLTATAVKDNFDNKWSLEAGALVMADMGIAVIDELDKMSDDDKSAFHEAMEQQQVTVTKAGILASLKTRCGVLGAANPKGGRFDMYESIAPQIDMPPALLSRFDFLFVMQDIPNKETDSTIAKHIIKTNRLGEMLANYQKCLTPACSKEEIDRELQEIKPFIDADLLRKYIAYSRKNIIPVMTPEAGAYFVNYYRNLRSNRDSNSPIPVTARQLEALVRMSEASARVRLSNTITLEDAKSICELSMACSKKVGTDPATGMLDVDLIEAGQSKSQRDKIAAVTQFLRNNKSEYPGGAVPRAVLFKHMKEVHDINESTTEELIEKMRRRGDAYTVVKDTVTIA